MLLKKKKDPIGAYTTDLAAKRDSIALEVKIDKVGINKSVDLPGLNNLKTKVNGLDLDKLKTVPVNLKKMSDLMSKEVAKKTGYNKLNMKVNNLENKIPDVTTFIQINTNQINKKKIRGDQFGKKK